MKKIMVFALSALLMVAFVSSSALAGSACSAGKTADASAVKATQASVTTDGSTLKECAAKMGMTPEECAKLCGMTAEECAKMCAGKENCGFTQMSVKGMTCGGCESTIKSALSAIDGVHHVIKVDHKEGIALVCCDPTKVDGTALTTAVANKGYQAEIIPAVAKTSDVDAKAQNVAGKACSPGCAKTCAAHAKAGCTGTKKTDETKTTTKSDES